MKKLLRILKAIGKRAILLFTWLRWHREWVKSEILRLKAEEKGCECIGMIDRVVYYTYFYNPNNPPQKKEHYIPIKKWFKEAEGNIDDKNNSSR